MEWIIGKSGRVYNVRDIQFIDSHNCDIQFCYKGEDSVLVERYATPEEAQVAIEELIEVMADRTCDVRVYRMILQSEENN